MKVILTKINQAVNQLAGKLSNRRCSSANGSITFTVGAVTSLIFVAVLALTSADNVSATTSTLTMSIDDAILDLDIIPHSANGDFAKSANSTISVTTNNYSGYTLSITANESTNLVGANGNIVSISGATSESDFSADNTTAATNYNGKWGYLPSRLNSTNNTVFQPSPGTNSNGHTLDITSTANTNNMPNTYTLAIGARVDNTTAPGAYSNTFVLSAVANMPIYSITYNTNTTDTVSGMPGNVPSAIASGITVNIDSAIPVRSGATFLGWCDTTTTVNGNSDSCSGNIYNPNGNGTNLAYNLSQTTVNNLSLYAMWSVPPTITFTAGSNIDLIMVADGSNKFKPQYATAGGSTSFTAVSGTKLIVTVVPKANYKLDSWTRSNSAGTLADTTLLTTTYIASSDSETLTAVGVSGTYTAMKDLTFSNCSASGINVTDTRNGLSYTVQKFGDYCYMLSNLRLAGGTTLTSATSDITSNFTLPDQTTWTSSSQNHFCEARMRYIGNEYYYNWYAAKANPTTGLTSSSSCATTTYDNASLGSICPANWKLPTYKDITAATLWNNGANPGALATSGYFYSDSQHNIGINGHWWSSDRYGNGFANYLGFDANSAGINISYKDYGFSLRCMKEKELYMQNVTSSDLATMMPNTGDTATLTDIRDGQVYTVAKLSDGKYWMTQNLALGKSTTTALTPDNTNISSNYTLPARGTSGTSYSGQYVWGTDNTACGNNSPCYGYYSYAAATAGTNPSSGEASSDICPKGWRLPTQAELTTLRNTYTTGATLTQSPFLGVYAGGYNRSSFGNGGSYGFYWSSTAYNSNYAYALLFSSSYSNVYYDYTKYDGYSIRCVAKS